MKWAERLCVMLLVAVTACDPCAGTPSCRVSPRVSYTGHVVERTTSRSVEGAALTFIRTGGVALAEDTFAPAREPCRGAHR